MITRPNILIYDFEGQIEPQMAAALLAGLTTSAPTSRETGALKSTRIETKLQVHNAEEHFYIVPGTNPPKTFLDVWNGTLRIRIATNRAKQGGDNSHGIMRAGVRWLMQNHKEEITPRLTLHGIVWALENSTQDSVANEREDVSELTFQIKFNIKPAL